jgi:hypothetical protein
VSDAGFQVTCYVSGTRIATPGGERAIESLAAGNAALTKSGEARLIVWIGRRCVDCCRHPKPHDVWPVRVHVGAFGDGLPHRDLWLSPNHSVFVENVLIPIKHLINGITIEQVPRNEVTYYHVELEHHDLLLAEGLPAESFLDMTDGSNYAGRHGPIRLYPDYAARMWEAFGYARLIVTGPELEAVRALVGRFSQARVAA